MPRVYRLHSHKALRRSLVAWLTLLAMSLAFLAPAVSRTLAVDAVSAFMPCPWHVGMAQPGPGDEADSTGAATVAGDACPLCALAFALPAAATANVPHAGATQARLLVATVVAPAWPAARLAQPRGPPQRA